MTDIKSMTIDELKELMTTLGDKPFRAKQIYSWLHEHLVTSYDEMTNEMCSYFGVYDLYQPETEENIFASIFSKITNSLPKSESQILSEKADEMESGVLMYYAEQLH